MTLTVLADGTARLEVEGISGANHVKAEVLTKEFAKLMGGDLKIGKRPHAMSKTHAHDHAHTGQGGDHDHNE
jgi:hypothetical protein